MIRKYVLRQASGAERNVSLFIMPGKRVPELGEGYSWDNVAFNEADGIMDGLLETLVTARKDGFALLPGPSPASA